MTDCRGRTKRAADRGTAPTAPTAPTTRARAGRPEFSKTRLRAAGPRPGTVDRRDPPGRRGASEPTPIAVLCDGSVLCVERARGLGSGRKRPRCGGCPIPGCDRSHDSRRLRPRFERPGCDGFVPKRLVSAPHGIADRALTPHCPRPAQPVKRVANLAYAVPLRRKGGVPAAPNGPTPFPCRIPGPTGVRAQPLRGESGVPETPDRERPAGRETYDRVAPELSGWVTWCRRWVWARDVRSAHSRPVLVKPRHSCHRPAVLHPQRLGGGAELLCQRFPLDAVRAAVDDEPLLGGEPGENSSE